MPLHSPDESQLRELMTWFSCQQEVDDWGGPNFQFPLVYKQFYDNLKLTELESFVLVNANDELMAFGQFYQRLSRCHLGRLAVAPIHRGRGLVAELMNQLSTIGLK